MATASRLPVNISASALDKEICTLCPEGAGYSLSARRTLHPGRAA